MTSRVSFPKLLLETLRRHLTSVLITTLIFVLHFITFFLNLQNTIQSNIITDLVKPESRSSELDYIFENVRELCSPNWGTAILSMLVGIFLAYDFFRYLHSKKETDFYESLPIKKEAHFWVRVISCFGVFTILSAITILLELALVYGTGYCTNIVTQNMLWSILCMIGVFFACFSTTILAMVLTGHPIVAFLGVGILSAYMPVIINFLIPSYASKFFETYAGFSMTENSKTLYLSPVTLAYKTMYDWTTWKISEHASYLIGCWIFAIVTCLIAYILFLRRPSETAGRAMAFEKINFAIRFMLVVPLSLYAGLFLKEMSYESSTAWLIFGIIFSAILIHAIIEAIFQFDIKAIFTKKGQLLVTILCSLVFFVVFRFDVFGYDNYIPSKNDLQCIELDSYMFGYENNDWEFMKNGLTGTDMENALSALKEIRDQEIDKDPENVYLDNINVTYTLKNGREVKRQYHYIQNRIPDSLDKLFATKAMKDDLCVLYHLDAKDISMIQLDNGIESMELKLTEKEKEEFIKIYLEEYTPITLKEHLKTSGVYDFTIEGKVSKGAKKSLIKENYYIFPTYKKTIAFVEQHGAVMFQNAENVTLKNLGIHSKNNSGDGYLYIEDEAQLNALLPYMKLGCFYEYNYYTDNGKEAYCELKYEIDGSTNFTDVYIRQEDIDKILNTH